MAGNVFGASNNAHVIKADKATVKIGTATALALGVTIQYQRPVQQVPVLAWFLTEVTGMSRTGVNL